AGPRGHLRRFGDLLDDVGLELAQLRTAHPALPLFVVGHSMGGLVTAAFAAMRAPEIAGAATSGAAFAVSDAPTPAPLPAPRLPRPRAPRLRMERPTRGEALSRDPEVGRASLADPLVLRRMSLGFGAAFLGAQAETLAAAPRVAVPMLILHGADDPLCPAEGSRRFFAGLRHHESALRVYPGLRHEILNEPEREAVLGDLLEWMARLAG